MSTPLHNDNESESMTTEILAESYDELFAHPGRLRDSDALYEWVLNILDPHSGQRLLDIGCGEGVLVNFARNRGAQSIGVDLSLVGAIRGRNFVSANVIGLADGEELPFPDQSFDFATNIGGLEHFLHPGAGLEEMHRILRRDGLAALILPNSYYLADIIWHVWRTGYSVSHKQALERFATYKEWWEFIEEHGFQVLRAYKYNLRFPRSSSDWQWYRQHPKKLLNLFVSPFVPFNLSYHFLYICTPQ